MAFVSPHLDDAALSCGGSIRAAARRGTAIVVTVFAAPLDLASPLPQARRFHTIMGFDAATDPGLRRREDERAMARLGAVPLHLDFEDCIYRLDEDGTPVVVSDDDLFSGEEAEAGMVESIADRLAQVLAPFSPAALVLPLGLGRHRDHRLARRGAEEAAPRLGATLSYYEDAPYCLRRGAEPAEDELEAVLVRLEPADLAARLEAVAEYDSQSEVTWNEEEPLGEAISRYVRALGSALGPGELAERMWRPVAE